MQLAAVIVLSFAFSVGASSFLPMPYGLLASVIGGGLIGFFVPYLSNYLSRKD